MTNDLVCISYPTGGFGNFVFHVVSEYFANTHKLDKIEFPFEFEQGNSHNTRHYLGIWRHDPDGFVFPNNDQIKKLAESNCTAVLLIDNGIDNDSYLKLKKTFDQCRIVRLTVDDYSKPVVIKRSINARTDSSIVDHLNSQVVGHWEEGEQPYSIRENFTLMYHNWSYGWGAVTGVVNISISDLIKNTLGTFEHLAHQLNDTLLDISNLKLLIDKWYDANKEYFKASNTWENLNDALDSGKYYQLPDLDLHDQGYINYCIERKYDVIIPVYDYRNWFQSSIDIQEMIKCLK